MTNRAIAALVGATIASVTAAIAVIGHWPGKEPLTTVAASAWILVAVIAAADHIETRLEQATSRLERAADNRHADGVIEGMRNATPGGPGLRGVH